MKKKIEIRGGSRETSGLGARPTGNSRFLLRDHVGFLFVVAVAALLVAGCSVGPDYHPPKVNVPAHWSEPLSGGETNAVASVAAWWKNFHDPELDSLIASAVQYNHSLRIAAARVREARALRGFADADFWPTMDASGSYTRNRFDAHGFLPLPPGTSLKGAPLDYNMFQAGFDASWEIDVFGGKRRAAEAARDQVAAAESDRRDLLVSLLAEVARNYLEARGFQQRLVIAQRNIKAQQEALDITRDRFQAGLTSELDVRQASALLANTEAQVPAFETALQAAIHRLGTLSVLPLDTLLPEMSAKAPIPSAPVEVPVDLPSELLRRRPDVQRAERELAAATARIGAAKADLFPKFYLLGTAGLGSVSASDWFTAGSRFWTAGPSVQWRIFDAGCIRANVRVQNARQEQALANYERAVSNSFEDVENALVAYAKEQLRRRSLEKAAGDAREALKISNDLYKNGLTDFLHVLDGERSLYLAEDQLVQSDRTVSVNLIALYKALGGGWDALGPSADSTKARAALSEQ